MNYKNKTQGLAVCASTPSGAPSEAHLKPFPGPSVPKPL